MSVRTDLNGLAWSHRDSPQPAQNSANFKQLRREAAQGAPVLARVAQHVASEADAVVRTRPGDEHPFPGIDIKRKARAREKANSELGGRFDLLTDLVRITIECPTLAAAYTAARALVAHCGPENVPRIRDRFAEPQKSGYSDIIANVRLPNGHIAEVQINVTAMIEAKEIEQILYSERRLIESGTIPDAHGRLALLAGAALCIYGTARTAIDEQRSLSGDERYFIRSFLPDGL